MTELQRLSETIERNALMDFHATASEQDRKHLGLSSKTIGESFVSVAKNDPSIVLNRVVGLATTQETSAREVTDICETYKQADVARFFLHVPKSPFAEEMTNWLSENDLVAGRRWMTFYRKPGPVEEAQTTFDVKEIGPVNGVEFGRIVTHGFDVSEQAIPVLAHLPTRPNWHVFMTFDGDRPCGAAALFIDNDIGWCDWSSTWPDYRGRGSQRALLAARLKKAFDLGCRYVFTETGEAVEGDPQHSYHNILWAGFNENYLRDNYEPRKVA